jgi:hypothetical protein
MGKSKHKKWRYEGEKKSYWDGKDKKWKEIGSEDKTWRSDLEFVETCGRKLMIPDISIGDYAYLLMRDFLLTAQIVFPGDEVGFYLLGDVTDKEEWIIDDIYVPKQIPRSAHVKDMEPIDKVGEREVIGIAHMFPVSGGENHTSGGDQDTCEGNHNISLVFGKELKCVANIRIKTPCGAFKVVKVTPDIVYGEGIDKEAMVAINRIKANVEEQKKKEVISSSTLGTINLEDYMNRRPFYSGEPPVVGDGSSGGIVSGEGYLGRRPYGSSGDSSEEIGDEPPLHSKYPAGMKPVGFNIKEGVIRWHPVLAGEKMPTEAEIEARLNELTAELKKYQADTGITKGKEVT